MSPSDSTPLDPAMSEQPSGSLAQSDTRGGLLSRGFIGLLVTQLLGSINDNMFRWLVVPIGQNLFVQIIPNKDQAAKVALSVGLACFVIPYLLLAAMAGFLADRFNKRSVIVGCKIAEVVIMGLGLGAIAFGNVYILFFVVAMMGSQSALFGPAKFGSIPELVRDDKISAANGVLGLTTVVAVVTGTIVGGLLFGSTWAPWTPSDDGGLISLWTAAGALLGVAAAGVGTSLLIPQLKPADPNRAIPVNPFGRTIKDLRLLGTNKPLLRAALGIAFFWTLGSMAQLNIDTFVKGVLEKPQEAVGIALAFLSLGVGVGSILAGIWSAGKVELGIVPLGAFGIAVSSMLLFTASISLGWFELWLFTLGVSAGLFNVPLMAYMQHRSPAKSRGAILAAGNFLTFSGMLITSGLFYFLGSILGLSPQEIFLWCGIGTIPVFIYIVCLLPQATIRFAVWLASHTIYRVRVYGRENLPAEGGALLVANHISWLDGVFLLITSSRPIRLLTDSQNIQRWPMRWICNLMGVIDLGTEPKSIDKGLDSARQALKQGELVCMFPEGKISRTGHLHPFQLDIFKALEGTNVPTIPVYLDELWGSIFSYHGGRAFWKWPKHWPYPVSIHFGSRLDEPENAHKIRHAVETLGVEALARRKTRKMILPRSFIRNCRRNKKQPKIADSTGVEMTGGNLLMRTLILRRILQREVLGDDERYVGVLLPPSAGGVLVNAALPLLNRVAVNLNYTVSSAVMNNCISQCSIRHVLTSRRVMEKLDLDIDAELVYLEDFKDKVTLGDKIAGIFQTYILPVSMLESKLGLNEIQGDDLLTVIFTSGSTGNPKGVMLTHYNVASNIEAIDQVIHLTKDDVMIGVLPFFHSYGYTVSMWTVLSLRPKGVYHFSPLDAKQIGKLCKKHGGTILLSTPTFLRSYLKRCKPEELSTLDVVFAAAEKLPGDLTNAFEEKFGVRPQEAFGATELSPLVSVNIPASRIQDTTQCVSKDGTVGRPIPGVAAKIVDPDSGENLGVDKPGLLLIKGPNVMKGYLNQPELTAEVIRDGWYVTGDIALIDEDGFVQITGRQSRFSKIGGEMVPHIKIEETLDKVLEADEDTILAVVTAVPDQTKGERLVIVHVPLNKTPEEICKLLADEGLPNLWIPSPDRFIEVDEIPVLGTGKLDLKGLKDVALKRFAQ